MNRFTVKSQIYYGVAILFGVSLAMGPSVHTRASAGTPGINEAKSTVGQDVQEAKKAQIQAAYGKLPLSFIQNDGQIDKKVKFYEKGSRRATFFTKDGVYWSLSNGQSSPTSHSSQSTLIKLTALGANKHPKIVAEGLQEGKVNYFIGNDPKKWRTNISTYQSVLYQEVYPGIDIKFYGNNQQMEYDIIVKPGADPSKVKLAYEGIEGLRVTDEGDLEIGLKGGTVLQKKPLVYQEIEGKRVVVAGTFKIQPRMNPPIKSFVYGFEVASYDKVHPLMIDPALVYSTYLGGSGNDGGRGIAVDASGNAYVTGMTSSTDFPIASPLQGAFGGFGVHYPVGDAFVTKINATGTALIYSTYLGGSDGDQAFGIAVDGSGHAYVTGATFSTDFPTVSPLQGTFGGGSSFGDAFVAKLNAAGNALVYSTYLGGSLDDLGRGIAVDASGNAYVTGMTSSIDFPTASPLQGTCSSCNIIIPGFNGVLHLPDAFVVKLNATGNALVYSTYLGGSGSDQGVGIAVDASGNAYVTGFTGSSDFPTASPYQATFSGGFGDAFVAKIGVVYNFIGFLNPLLNDGSRVFKLGGTVPVKFQLTDRTGAFVTNATATLTVQVFSGGSLVGTPVDATPSGGSNSGSLFRYDSTSNQYIFNLSTNPLFAGTWQIQVHVNDGSLHTVLFGLR